MAPARPGTRQECRARSSVARFGVAAICRWRLGREGEAVRAGRPRVADGLPPRPAAVRRTLLPVDPGGGHHLGVVGVVGHRLGLPPLLDVAGTVPLDERLRLLRQVLVLPPSVLGVAALGHVLLLPRRRPRIAGNGTNEPPAENARKVLQAPGIGVGVDTTL